MNMVMPPETLRQAARRLAERAIRDGFEAEAIYPYTDAEGNELYARFRLRHATRKTPKGKAEKHIRPVKREGDRYVMGEPDFPDGKPLYHLHMLAANPDAPVVVVEGENKVEALAHLGILATTSGSATSAAGTDWGPLAGRTALIWADNDQPGRQYAEDVRRILLGQGVSVTVVDAAALGLGEGDDAVDWLAAHPGATATDVDGLPRASSSAPAHADIQARDDWPEPKPMLRACIEAATEPEGGPASAPDGPTSSAGTLPYVELLRGDSIKPEAVAWIWSGYLVGGKVNILAGAPGTGKTTLALALAATLTIGGRWPDGTGAAHGDVLMWSGEDGVRDTLVPRLLACGADMRRVRFVGRVREGNEMRPFDPARDLAELRRAMLDAGKAWKLLIVDSIVSATSGDSHKNAEVRKGLEPLGALADETGCAILGISHFTKGTAGRDPLERVTGSLAFGAYARIVLATAKRDHEHGGGRIVTRAKSNLGPDGGGFVYDIEQTETPGYPGIFASRVLWGDAIEGTAREILADAEAQPDDGEGGALAEAKAFLGDLLADGPVSANQVRKDADGAGYSWATIRRAQKALNVAPVKEGLRAGWVWRMPAEGSPMPRRRSTNPEDAQQNNVSTFGKSEHLGADDAAQIEGAV